MPRKAQKKRINTIANVGLNTVSENKKIEKSIIIRDTEQYQIESFDEKKNSSKNSEIKKDGKEEDDDENKPLLINKKLIKIFNNINKNIEENPNKDIEEIYDNYHEKKETKIKIKDDISECCIFIMFIIVGGLFLLINLMAILTTKTILESLYEIFINSVQYFLYKKSDLESHSLTDFESLYNSSYNFYNQYYKDISSNKVDFDLIMFWDFVGSLFYECFDFVGTSILFFLLNVILLILIGGFNFLDIDEKMHKYTFFQILYITLVYFFLWISVSGSALLSQQAYINSYQILKKKLKKEKRNELKRKQKEEDNKKGYTNSSNQNEEENKAYTYENKNKNDNKSNKDINKDNNSINSESTDQKKDEGNKNFQYFYIIYITSFFGFFIDYVINRAIIKYRKKYISKELENSNIEREEAYLNIYSKDRKLFLFTVFIPYCAEIVISLIIYGIFYCVIFTKREIDSKKNINKEKLNLELQNNIKIENDESDNKIKIRRVSIKKILGYTIFNQTIIEKQQNFTTFESCCECFKLLFQSIRECLRSSFCLICEKVCPKCTYCYKCDCCECKCSLCCCKFCKKCCSCCFIEASFEQKEMKVCICYQEKRKLKWFKYFINNKTQKKLVQIVFLIAYFQAFSIGFQKIYEDENNKESENIMLPLFISFLEYTISSSILGKLFYKGIKCVGNSGEQPFFKYLNSKLENIFEDLSASILIGSLFIFTINGVVSFYSSILYFTNKKFFDKDKELYLIIFLNKYAIFVLTYFCKLKM